MNILEELYYGNINPNEKHFRRKSEYEKFVKIISSNEEKLKSYLDEEAQRLLLQLMDAQTAIAATGERERFIEGWKLGAQFVLDTFLMPHYSPFAEIYEE